MVILAGLSVFRLWSDVTGCRNIDRTKSLGFAQCEFFSRSYLYAQNITHSGKAHFGAFASISAFQE
jgi:hypothetical protein